MMFDYLIFYPYLETFFHMIQYDKYFNKDDLINYIKNNKYNVGFDNLGLRY